MPLQHPRLYTLNIRTSSANPNDSTTYYAGAINMSLTTVAGYVKIAIPQKGKIVACVITEASSNTPTTENVQWIIRKNSTTDYAVNTSGLGDGKTFIENYNLNIPVDQGDYIELKIVTPAWVTNPIGVQIGAHILVQCP